MRKAHEGKPVQFLALSLEPDEALVQQAAASMGISMLVATTEQETLGPLSVRQVPSTVFVDEKGNIVAAASGARSRSFFEKRVRALLEP